ncbi:hypothetical protein GEA64_02085 [Photorhabdus khanii]|uniref:Uncharacterized protein n=1 Tax=Photorhabdus khanii TaxID=1004150 RepID=A0A7C9KB48_9GAMM|nr:hypothetical protein [Photorhabdus khanii]
MYSSIAALDHHQQNNQSGATTLVNQSNFLTVSPNFSGKQSIITTTTSTE